MKMKQPGIRGAPSAAYRLWNSLGDSPTSWRNRLLNEPRLEKPDRVTDLGDGQVGGAEQVLGALDPALGEVGGRGESVRRGEEPLEVVLAHPRDAGERRQVERLAVVPVGVVAGAAQVDEHVARCAECGHRREVSRRRSSASRRSRVWSRSRREAITAAR